MINCPESRSCLLLLQILGTNCAPTSILETILALAAACAFAVGLSAHADALPDYKKYAPIIRENIGKDFKGMYRESGGGPNGATELINTLVFNQFGKKLYGMSAAYGVILFIITAIAGLLVLRLRDNSDD